MFRNRIFKVLSSLFLLMVLSAGQVSSVSLKENQAPVAQTASPIRYLPGFQTNSLAANDDSSTGATPIGFTINFFNQQHNTLYVNNNGNVTFDAAQTTFTPYNLTSSAREIIAAFFGDVDTRGAGSALVAYGNDTVDGRHDAFRQRG